MSKSGTHIAENYETGSGIRIARNAGSISRSGIPKIRYWMFRAVAPNARENHDAAERRRQMIQESKYLGGDMEHTHLVKGLDFALLQKVRYQRFKVSVFGTVPYTLGYRVRCRYPTSEYDILYFKTWIYILSRILPYLSHISVHLRCLFYL